MVAAMVVGGGVMVVLGMDGDGGALVMHGERVG